MKGTVNIAVNLAPKNYRDFKRWHKAACGLDNLTSAERWVKMGNKLPNDNKRTKKEK